MSGARSVVLLVVAALAVGGGAGLDGQTVTAGRPLTGRWGGDQVRLDATATGAKLQIGCHLATVEGPVAPDASGAFTLTLTFVPVRGVHIEGDETHPKSTVKGRVEKDTLRLTIEPPVADAAGTLTLTRNGTAKLPNCRMRS